MSNIKKIICVVMAITLISATIVEFDSDAIGKVFNDKANALFLFTSTNEQSVAARKAFEEFDATNPSDLFLTVSDSEDGHNLYVKLADYFGVDINRIPHILYYSSESIKYNFEGKITLSTIQDFVAKAQAGQIEPFYKSHPIPEKNDDYVKVIVGKMFKDYVLNSDKEFLIEFYAPWCGHCKHLEPKYHEAAKILSSNPNIVLAKVDSTGNEITGINIEGFPTIKFWRKDKSIPPIDFNGAREVDGIINWLRQNTEYPWVEGQQQSQEQL